ncbi:MAG: hypothetical protein QW804_04150 [Candidatus Bathyarchaeia archaeon]|nr:hypothetical protein [Candidatus Bathyarchaeota archaeon]
MIRKLQGIVIGIERTGEYITDEEGDRWEKCILTIELIGFSKRTPNQTLPENLKGKRVKIVRYCLYDWHYKLGVKKTLELDETEAVLSGKPTQTVFW